MIIMKIRSSSKLTDLRKGEKEWLTSRRKDSFVKCLNCGRRLANGRALERHLKHCSVALSWPVVHAYVPMWDAWRVSGLGTAGIVRERPDGHLTYSFFTINLLEDGINLMFGKTSTAQEFDEMIECMRDQIPPFEDGAVKLVSDYVWGAHALSEEHDVMWDEADVNQYLRLVPKPPGNRQQWLERLIGPNGLTPRGLVEVIRNNPQPEDLPEGREIAIFTEMSFHIEDEREVFAELRKHEPDFKYCGREGDEKHFDWTREYPPDHWSPLASLGGRQILGHISVRPDRLIAEARTLSMACRLTYLLKNILAEKLTLDKTTWTELQDILRAKKQQS